MSAPTTFADGKLSKMTVGGTIFYLTSFKFGQKFDKHDVTSSPNSGKKQYQLGLSEVPFSGEAFFNLSAGPIATLQPGSLVHIVWFADGTNAAFDSSYCVIEDVEFTAPTNDIIKISFSGSAGPDYTTTA